MKRALLPPAANSRSRLSRVIARRHPASRLVVAARPDAGIGLLRLGHPPRRDPGGGKLDRDEGAGLIARFAQIEIRRRFIDVTARDPAVHVVPFPILADFMEEFGRALAQALAIQPDVFIDRDGDARTPPDIRQKGGMLARGDQDRIALMDEPYGHHRRRPVGPDGGDAGEMVSLGKELFDFTLRKLRHRRTLRKGAVPAASRAVQTIATRFARTAQSQLPAELLTLAEPPLRVSHTGGSVSLATAWPPPDAVAAANPPGVVQTASATEPLPDDRASALHLESDSAKALAPRAPIAFAEPPPAVHTESTVAPAPDAVAVESHLRSALASASPLPLALEPALPLLVTVEIATPPFLATAIAFEVPSDDASQTAVS